jgi:hypothetical protein
MVTLNNDLDILNFSLTYEFLEFAQYQAVANANLLSGTEAQYLARFIANESEHIRLLRAAITQLGGTPVQPLPAYNLPRIASRNDAVMALGLFCDNGAGAYLGAAPLIQSRDILLTGVNFHNIEAEQAATWRSLAGMQPAPFTVARGLTPDQVVTIITPYLQAPGSTPPPLPPQPPALIATGSIPAAAPGTSSGTGTAPSSTPSAATTPATSTPAATSQTTDPNLRPFFIRRLGQG